MEKAVLKNKLILLCSILFAIILLAGTSYAYFSATGTDSKEHILKTTDCATIAFESDNHVISKSVDRTTSFNNLWNDGDYYTFKVTNKCSRDIKIDIGVQNKNTTTIATNRIRIVVNRVNEYNSRRVVSLSSADTITTDTGLQMSGVYTDFLPANGTQTYRMNIIIVVSGNTMINQKFEANLAVVGTIVTWSKANFAAPSNWYSSEDGTLLYALRNDKANKLQTPVSTPGLEPSAVVASTTINDGTVHKADLSSIAGKTIYYSASRTKNVNGTYSLSNPTSLVLSNTNLQGTLKGKYITFDNANGDVFYVNDVQVGSDNSTYYIYYSYQTKSSELSSDEAIMSSEPDEYSVSYYFRGNVQNNYVQFAGKCWRIVRVMGNGAIKLVLENGDGSSCSSSNPFIKNSGTVQTGTYGTAADSDFKGSNAETVLSTWATNNLSNYTDYLEDIIYCNDTSIRNTNYNPTLYDGTNSIAFSGLQKFNKSYNNNIPRPTYSCPSGGLVVSSTPQIGNYSETSPSYRNVSVITGLKSKVGMLTADEALFAGLSIGYDKAYIGNNKSYLYSSAANNYAYYTITPADYKNSTPSVYGIKNNYVTPIVSTSNDVAYRPVIALKSDTIISGGDGTVSNPYIIATDTLISQNTANTSSTSKAFSGPITKSQVEKIVIKNTNTVPSNAINSWDVGNKLDGSIMAYTLDEDNDSLYELYIGQEGGVVVDSDASYMFANYTKLESIDLTNIKTTKVTDMSHMFSYNAATSLDLSSFDTSKVTDMSNMFDGSSATEIKGLNKFNTSKVTNMSVMFYGVKVTSLDLSNFDTSNVTSMVSMFHNSAATKLDLSSFHTINVKSMEKMFFSSSATEIKGLDKFVTPKVTNMSYMFSYSAATILDLNSFDTSKVTTMSHMFDGSYATEIKGLNRFNTSNVTDMSVMFYGGKATSLDLSSFDTSKVTNMSQMFRINKATSLDLSSFDTSKVTNMDNMFYNCAATTGYARTQTDADKFNATSNKPSGLTFVVKS